MKKLFSLILFILFSQTIFCQESNCSNFNDIEHLFEASGFTVESKEDFEAIPDDKWNEFIVKNTSFNSWEDMQKEAMNLYVKEQLLKGL